MATIAEALALAIDHHLSGRRAEAEILYRRILDADPRQPDALHLLGVLAGQAGDADTAATLIGQAMALNPASPDYPLNLANIQRSCGRLGEAVRHYAAALALAPAREDALDGYAVTAARLGEAATADMADWDEAAFWYRRALAVRPTLSEALFNLAHLSPDVEAATLYDRAGRLGGDAEALSRSGRILKGLNRPAEAAEALRAALAADPDRPVERSLLWKVERALGRHAAYHGHDGQDAFVHRTFFPALRGGVFLDIGAYDGVTWSNTLFFEREMGWTGLCVEASPTRFAELAANRACACVNVALSGFEGEAEFLDVIDGPLMMGGLTESLTERQRDLVERGSDETRLIRVPVRRPDRLLADHGVRHVHYCSIDVEGAERAIIDAIDFTRVTIDVFTLENIGADGTLRGRMAALGYDFVCRFDGQDEVYARRGLPRA